MSAHLFFILKQYPCRVQRTKYTKMKYIYMLLLGAPYL